MPDSDTAPVPAPDPWSTWDTVVGDLMNHGHGHVVPRPDGTAQKCRKAPECRTCLEEVRALRQALTALLEALMPEPAVLLGTLEREVFVNKFEAPWPGKSTLAPPHGGIVSPGRGPTLAGETVPSEGKVIVEGPAPMPLVDTASFRASSDELARSVREALRRVCRRGKEVAHGGIVSQSPNALMGETPTLLSEGKLVGEWATPPPSLFDVFPGQLRLDPGEPLAPQGGQSMGSGWYRLLEDVMIDDRGTLLRGTLVEGQTFRAAWLREAVADSTLVPCTADGTPLWPWKDADAAD